MTGWAGYWESSQRELNVPICVTKSKFLLDIVFLSSSISSVDTNFSLSKVKSFDWKDVWITILTGNHPQRQTFQETTKAITLYNEYITSIKTVSRDQKSAGE